jgi:hypothetical protein
MKAYGIKKKKHFIFYDSSEGSYDYCNVYDKFFPKSFSCPVRSSEIKEVGMRKITSDEFKDVFHDDIGDDFDTLSPKEQEERIIDYLNEKWIYDEDHIDFVRIIDEIQDVVFFDKKDAEKYIRENDIDAFVFEFKPGD